MGVLNLVKGRREEEITRDELNLQDDYDLYELASRVHSKEVDMLNRDFTLSCTTQALEDWSIKQKILAKDLFDILKTCDKDIAKNARTLLNSEVKDRLVFTRSRDGLVLKSLLRRGGSEEVEERKKMGWFKGLFNDKTKQEEVVQ